MKSSLAYLQMGWMVFVLASCALDDGRKGPSSSGRAYELLVVVDDSLWNRPAGRALHGVLDADVPGLPQSEPAFRIMHASVENFDNTLKLVRNIVLVDIDSSYAHGSFKFSRDVYASPQMILKIQSSSEEEFAEYVTTHKQWIIDFLTRVEMKRQIQYLHKDHNKSVARQVDSLFGCDVWVSSDLVKCKIGKNFIWASTGRAKADCNFVMYTYPYRDKNTFTKKYILHKRDSVMKANIPGYRDGVYMSTDTLFSVMKPIAVHEQFAFEGRGLWRMKGDFMGGPYVSHSRIDEQNHRVVTAEIFVYAPERKKSDLVRQMEASLYTLMLPLERQKQDSIPA